MKRQEFDSKLTSLFAQRGFICKKKTYYKEISNEVTIVFGLQKSSYGAYYYLEYGFCFGSINQNMPYPKLCQINLNCGRIMTSIGKAIEYEKLPEGFMDELEQHLDEIITEMKYLVNLGKDEFIRYFLSGKGNQSWFILGAETADYFGLSMETFKYHIVLSP